MTELEPRLLLRLVYALGACAILSAGMLLNASVRQWYGDDPQLEQLRNRPSAVQLFRDRVLEGRDDVAEQTSPVIAQARTFASYVNSTSPAQEVRSPAPQVPARSRPTPAVRPKASSVAFKLHGTSVYPDRPERSMALISEPGGSEGERKWVREGAALGHFVVQEIRRGVVVLSDGDAVREMTVEPGPDRRSLVRNVRSGSQAVSVALRDGTRRLIQSRLGGHEIGQSDRTVNNSD